MKVREITQETGFLTLCTIAVLILDVDGFLITMVNTKDTFKFESWNIFIFLTIVNTEYRDLWILNFDVTFSCFLNYYNYVYFVFPIGSLLVYIQ